jgi:hypothetical protein
MAQIRQGSEGLRRVALDEKKARPASDSRGDLLDQIRSGVALKKVDAESDRNSNSEQNGPAFSGIAGMLQRALHERSAAICPSSSDDDEAPEDDDKWDD